MKTQKKAVSAAQPTKTNTNEQFVTVQKGEKANIDIVHKGDNKVACTLSAKPDNQSPVRYQMHWTFDFSNCTPEEVQEIAANYCKIRMQDAWRKDPTWKDAEKWNNATFNVKTDILSRTRTRGTVNTMKKAEKLVKTLTPEQKAELLKALSQ